jgi:hypothetical protein
VPTPLAHACIACSRAVACRSTWSVTAQRPKARWQPPDKAPHRDSADKLRKCTRSAPPRRAAALGAGRTQWNCRHANVPAEHDVCKPIAMHVPSGTAAATLDGGPRVGGSSLAAAATAQHSKGGKTSSSGSTTCHRELCSQECAPMTQCTFIPAERRARRCSTCCEQAWRCSGRLLCFVTHLPTTGVRRSPQGCAVTLSGGVPP